MIMNSDFQFCGFFRFFLLFFCYFCYFFIFVIFFIFFKCPCVNLVAYHVSVNVLYSILSLYLLFLSNLVPNLFKFGFNF